MKPCTFLLVVMLAAIHTLSQAQPPSECWGSPISYQKTVAGEVAGDRGPLVANVTGDAAPEILVVGAAPGGTRRDRVFVYNAAGELIEELVITDDNYSIQEVPAVSPGGRCMHLPH